PTGNTNELNEHDERDDRPNFFRTKCRVEALQRRSRHDLLNYRGKRYFHDLRGCLPVLCRKEPQWSDAAASSGTADSQYRLSSIQQCDHYVCFELVEEGRHEAIQLLVAGNHFARSLFPVRHRSRMASVDLRERAHDQNQPLWHNLLLARRLARFTC